MKIADERLVLYLIVCLDSGFFLNLFTLMH